MAGRKPKPAATKKLEGNPGKRRLNTKEAKCLEIKAYDYMVWFEKAFSAWESIPLPIILLICLVR